MMRYVWYLVGAMGFGVGMIWIIATVRAATSIMRTGEIAEGRHLLYQGLPKGLGMLLISVWVIVLAYLPWEGGRIILWPGIVALFLFVQSRLFGRIYRPSRKA